MKTLSQVLYEKLNVPSFVNINEAFSSNIIANLHKSNSEVMNQFFRSLAKYRYSINGLKDDFITESTDVSNALKRKSNDIVKFWMIGDKIAAISCGNALVDDMFNWVSKGQGKRNNDTLIGDKEAIQYWLAQGDSYAKKTFTTCYMVAVSSLKALGEKKQPTEVVNRQTEELMIYKPNLLEVPKKPKKKPSDLKKLKDTSKTVDVLFKSGDTYDLSDPGYTDKFKYYSGEGDGYIMDKEYNAYDVFCSEGSSDSGRIAGGTMNWRCSIKIDNQTTLQFSGYHGVFSSPSSSTCGSIVSDIKNGMFLEDYIARHYNDLDSRSNLPAKIQKFLEAGDPNAKTFNGIKSEISQTKETNYFLTYILLPKLINFSIKQSGIEFTNILRNDKELENNSKELQKLKYGSEEYKQMRNAREKLVTAKTEVVVNGILKPLISRELKNIFQTGSIASYTGVESTLFCKNIKSSNHTIALDTKTNTLVIVDTNELKVVGKAELDISDTVILYKKDASPKAFDLFKKTSDAWMKMNKNKQTEYVNNNWETVYNNSYKSYHGYDLTQARAKQITKQDYLKMLDSHDFNKQNILRFSWDLIKNYIEGELDNEPKNVSSIEPLPEPDTYKSILPKKVIEEAGAKMDAWHAGTRKQNIKSMSDAKLKMNYEICKGKGYTKEATMLKTEALNRNILLECSGLNECLEIIKL